MRLKNHLIAAGMAIVLSNNAQAVCCGDGAVAAAGSIEAGGMVVGSISKASAAVSYTISTATAAMVLAINESTAQIVGALEGVMKVGAFANVDALNAHKNAIIMAMVASEKSRVSSEQSLATLPLANQTGAASVAAKQGEDARGVVSAAANTSLARMVGIGLSS